MNKEIELQKLLKIIMCPICKSKCTLEDTNLICSNCNKIYPIIDGIPIMLADELKSTAWDRLYEKGVRGNPIYGVTKTEYSLQKILNNLPFALSKFPAVELLYDQETKAKLNFSIEIGCGTGASSLLLKKLGLVENVILVDTSMYALKLSRELFDLFDEPAYFIVANGLSLPFNDKAFDISISCGLLEHFKGNEQQKIIFEHCRVADKVLCQVPTHSFTYWLQRWGITILNKGWPFGYEKPITEKQMKRFFGDINFKPDLIGYHDLLSVIFFFLLYHFNLKPPKKRFLNRLLKTDIVILFMREDKRLSP